MVRNNAVVLPANEPWTMDGGVEMMPAYGNFASIVYKQPTDTPPLGLFCNSTTSKTVKVPLTTLKAASLMIFPLATEMG